MGVKVNEDCTFCSRTVSYLTREGILMLVLSRQVDEKIIIGDSIVITVVEIRRGLVRLGIDAPRECARPPRGSLQGHQSV